MEQYSRKFILDIFSEKLKEKFEVFCKEHRQYNNLENFITYLIDQELISSSTIKHYAINETFNELFDDNEKQKTEVVNTLANRFSLSPRSIWNALRKNTAPDRNYLKVSSKLYRL